MNYLLLLLVSSTRLLVISISSIPSVVQVRVLGRRCICIRIIPLGILIKSSTTTTIPLCLFWLVLNQLKYMLTCIREKDQQR